LNSPRIGDMGLPMESIYCIGYKPAIDSSLS
jgi:hypothetical protein